MCIGEAVLGQHGLRELDASAGERFGPGHRVAVPGKDRVHRGPLYERGDRGAEEQGEEQHDEQHHSLSVSGRSHWHSGSAYT